MATQDTVQRIPMSWATGTRPSARTCAAVATLDVGPVTIDLDPAHLVRLKRRVPDNW